jgi:hypothetical protein
MWVDNRGKHGVFRCLLVLVVNVIRNFVIGKVLG